MCPDTFEVFEDCVGLYATDNSEADTLTQLIKDALVHLSLPLECCRRQCYNSASNMSGRISGAAAQIQQIEPRALIFIARDTVSTLLSKTLAVP